MGDSTSALADSERRRRDRGTATDYPAVFGRVSPEAKARLDRAANATGESMAKVLEHVLLNLDLDRDGRPMTWRYEQEALFDRTA